MYPIMAGLFLTFFVVIFASRKLNDSVKAKIKQEGLYHVTRFDCVEKIMNEDQATLLPSGRLKSYSSMFRKSTFFFCGQPTQQVAKYNMKKECLREEMVSIYIHPDSITEEMLRSFRFRLFDRAIIFKGTFTGKAEVVRFKRNDLVKTKHIIHAVFYTFIVVTFLSLGVDLFMTA